MITLTRAQRLRHLWIRSRWRRWLLPFLCSVPYLGSVVWLLLRGQAWIAQIMLAPLLMTGLLALLSLVLARWEFRR